MEDRPTVSTDRTRTEINRTHVEAFGHSVLIERNLSKLPEFVQQDLIQHSPEMPSGADALLKRLQEGGRDVPSVQYLHLHRILTEGDFTLTVCGGMLDGVHTSYYDLYRLQEGRVVEHWDTIEIVPPVEEWQNGNGTF